MRLPLRALALGLLLPGSVAQASVVTFTDRPTWLAHSTGVTTIDFEGIAPDSSFVFYPSPPGVTLTTVNFQVSSGTSLYIVDDGYLGGTGGYDRGSGAMLHWQHGSAFPNALTVTLPAGISAIGLDLGGAWSTPSQLLLTLSTGDSFVVPAPEITVPAAFFGLTSTADIGFLTLVQVPGSALANDNLNFALDNFSFGAAAVEPSPVPEPSAILLLGTALAGLMAGRKRSR